MIEDPNFQWSKHTTLIPFYSTLFLTYCSSRLPPRFGSILSVFINSRATFMCSSMTCLLRRCSRFYQTKNKLHIVKEQENPRTNRRIHDMSLNFANKLSMGNLQLIIPKSGVRSYPMVVTLDS
jgi:hypothetical protein